MMDTRVKQEVNKDVIPEDCGSSWNQGIKVKVEANNIDDSEGSNRLPDQTQQEESIKMEFEHEESTLDKDEEALEPNRKSEDESNNEETKQLEKGSDSERNSDTEQSKSKEPMEVLCRLCGYTCQNSYALRDHLHACHPDEKEYRCMICFLKFKGNSSYRQHLQEAHEGFELECKICLEKYNKGRRKHGDHQKLECLGRLLFQCNICQLSYVSKGGLWKHLDGHELSEGQKENSFVERRSKTEYFSCVMCEDDLSYMEAPYKEHIKQVHKGFCVKCQFCSRPFKSLYVKTAHVRRDCKISERSCERLKAKKSDCPKCSKSFRNEPSLVEHIRRIHNKQPVSCDICGLKVASVYLMRYHKTKVHTEPQHECPECKKKFHIKVHLTTHLQIHVKDRAVICEECGLPFKETRLLARHIARHHRSTVPRQPVPVIPDELKTHECLDCGKRFSKAFYLRRHRQSHDPDRKPAKVYSCDICGATFTDESSCRKHKKSLTVHTSRTCEVCNTFFRTQDRYEEHLKNNKCQTD